LEEKIPPPSQSRSKGTILIYNLILHLFLNIYCF
jgi:hypothetical protein